MSTNHRISAHHIGQGLNRPQFFGENFFDPSTNVVFGQITQRLNSEVMMF
jgi:hypothetical protein